MKKNSACNLARTPEDMLESLRQIRPDIKSLSEISALEWYKLCGKVCGRKTFLRAISGSYFIVRMTDGEIDELLELLMYKFTPPGREYYHFDGRPNEAKLEEYRQWLRSEISS